MKSKFNTDSLAFVDCVVQNIRKVVGESSESIPLHIPEFNGREREVLVDCIDTGWVSSVGSYVDYFESEVARHSGCLHGVVVSNGTVALQIALIVAGVKAGDEVLVPALTFVATANAISHIGAIPHFVDSEPETLGICTDQLQHHLDSVAVRRGSETWNRETKRRIAAIVPVHVFGCPVDFDKLTAVVANWPMEVVEDAAESLGSFYKGRPCGSLGRLAALSFNGNKIITTGGGGAIVTNDPALARRAKHLTTTAKLPHRWAFLHDEIGFNYRMPNLNAALGVAQLEQLDNRVIKKQKLFEAYSTIFKDLNGIQVFKSPKHSKPNNWLVTLMLDLDHTHLRDTLLNRLNDEGIMTRPIWTLMNRLPMYLSHPQADLSQAEELSSRALNIPSSAYLGAT